MEKASRTGFRSFFFVAHIPGSQNVVQRSMNMETTNKNRNAKRMTGLSRASDGVHE